MPPSKHRGRVPAEPQVTPKVKKKRIKVTATATGYYDYGRRREGDVFWIDEPDFSEKWMEKAPANAAESVSGSQDEITRQHDEILAARAGANVGGEEL